MLRQKHQRTGSRLRIEALESRAMLSWTPIHVDTDFDVVDPSDGVTSLREAIAEAEATDHDVLILLPAGDYHLEQGELRIEDANGKVKIQSPGATIDAYPNNHRVLHVSGSNTEVELKGLTITGGNDTDAEGDGRGGGIFNNGSRLTIKNSHVTEKISNDGGGIQNRGGGTLVLKNSVVSNNTSEVAFGNHGNGGGIANLDATLIVINSQVIDNVADRDTMEPPFFTGGLGGGVISIGRAVTNAPHSVTIINSSFSGNTANGGGGAIAIFSFGEGKGTLTVKNSTISDNTAVDDDDDLPRFERGGGIFSWEVAGGTNDVTLINSWVTDNKAGKDGGGIAMDAPGALILKNSRVTDNEAGNDGGGIWIGGLDTATLNKSRVNENEAEKNGDQIFNADGAIFESDRPRDDKDDEPDDDDDDDDDDD